MTPLLRTPEGIYYTSEDVHPFTWHKEAFTKFDALEYAAILADVGCGKSALFLYLAVAKYMRGMANAVLLFAPNSVYRQWATQQIPQHCAVPYSICIWGEHSPAKDKKLVEDFTAEEFEGIKFLIVNVEAMSHDTYITLFQSYVKAHKTIVGVDEATRIKTHTAKRTINIVVGLNRPKFLGKRLVDVEMLSVARYILTGSIVTNSPYDLYSLFGFLKINFFNTSFTQFKARYGLERKCQNHAGRIYFKKLTLKEMQEIRKHIEAGCPPDYVALNYGTTLADILFIVNHPDISLPWKNLGELKSKIMPWSYTAKIEDCFDDIPERQYFTLDVTMSDEQKKVYSALKRNLYVALGGDEMTVTNKLVLVTRLQQVTGGFVALREMENPTADLEMKLVGEANPKYQVLKEDIEANGEYPVLIFCRYTAEAKYIQDMLRVDLECVVELIIGEVKVAKREEILADFDEGKVHVIVATPGCLSTGRNLQKSHIIYFYSNSYSADERLQTEGRIHRAGQKNACMYKDLVCRGTVDERVIEALLDKKDLIDYMRGGEIKEFL